MFHKRMTRNIRNIKKKFEFSASRRPCDRPCLFVFFADSPFRQQYSVLQGRYLMYGEHILYQMLPL